MLDVKTNQLEVPKGWHARLRARLVFVGCAVVLSALTGTLAAQPVFDRTELRVSYYSTEASEAQLFLSDAFGNVLTESARTMPVEMGINNLAVLLSGSQAQHSFLQRFDPCQCATPLLLEKIWLADSFHSERLDLGSALVVGGTLSEEGTSYRLVPDSSRDPQLVLYADVRTFSKSAAAWRFGTVAALSLGLALLLGVIAALILQRNRTRVEGASHFRERLRRRRTPGDAAVALFGIILVLGIVQQVSGAYAVGVTLDEPLHIDHLRNYFEIGTFSSAAYGPLIALLGHGMNVVLGAEVWGYPLESAQAYGNRHLVVAVFGVTGTLGVATTAGVVLKSWRWGVAAGALASSVPLWVGHSMFNIKDVPVATGYTLLTLGLVLVISSSIRRAVRLPLGATAVIVGATVVMGTRPGMAPLLMGSIAVAFGVLFFAADKNMRFAIVAVSSITGTLLGIWLFFGHGQGLLNAVARSTSFPWSGTNLYGGELVGSIQGLGLVIKVLSASLPLALIVLIVVGVGFGFWALTSRSGAGKPSFETRAAIAIIGVQAFGALASVPILDPVIYDSGRQLLFIIPAATLFAVFGLFGLLQVLRLRSRWLRVSRSMVLLAVMAGLSVVQFDQVKLFPYNYAYYNAVAQGSGISGQWQTDYWGASIRELATPVAFGDFSTCRSVGDMNLNREALEPCGVLAPYVGAAAPAGVSVLSEREFWVAALDRSLAEFGPIDSASCTFHSQVTRVLRGEEVSMARLYVCQDR